MDTIALPCCNPSIFKIHLKPRHYPKKLITLGDHIKATRLDRGLFQKDLAKLWDCTESTIYNWENDRVEIPERKYKIINEWLESDSYYTSFLYKYT